MRVGGPAVHRPCGLGESRFRVGFLLLGLSFQRRRIVNLDIIPFFPGAPFLPILLVQIELDGFLGISQVAQRFPGTFFPWVSSLLDVAPGFLVVSLVAVYVFNFKFLTAVCLDG
ncbi:hypothetical protein DSO57_1027387 [Entomophthora muscae]|uniref:Uncharacterized protein n=1 Tax=Entomophthora muscae TaxID=34485 RepID=A0ACC2RSX3_9FUNG|nr:hypothetical protein DSO57_1027387 [Entomophthora muscae]